MKILIFGPDPTLALSSPTSKSGQLAQKRIEIKHWLEAKGHLVHFPEDIYAATSSGGVANLPFQEIAMMKTYDVVVALVDSPGSLTELGLIASRPQIAQKTHVFMDENYNTGFAYQTAQSVVVLKGAFNSFKFPDDIQYCHLLTAIGKTVEDLQLAKYLIL